jgi:hypothetical protein
MEMDMRRVWTQAMQRRLDELYEDKKLYKDRERQILLGEAQSYTIGPRSKSNYQLSIEQIRNTLKQIQAEIDELESIKVGKHARKAFTVIPRDL